MHEDRRTGLPFHVNRARCVNGICDPTLKKPVPSVIQGRSAVTSGYHLQTAIAGSGVIQIEEDGNRVMICQRVLGDILMPLNDRPDGWRLHVDLTVVEQEVGA